MDKPDNASPLPLFDNLEVLSQINYQTPSRLPPCYQKDFEHVRQFLLSYRGNAATFNAYRREAERYCLWCFYLIKKSLLDIRRTDFENYLAFCQNPPTSWISLKKVNRFLNRDGLREPNGHWRPFVVTISKIDRKQGREPTVEDYLMSEKALREVFAITGSIYNFLIQEDYAQVNPVAQIRQKSKYFRKQQGGRKIRRLSELQWGYVIETAELMAKRDPLLHQRTLFIMNALYGMYLRISELTASERWLPQMGDFNRDHDGLWWFTTVGKGNKERQISVSEAMLNALRHYRHYLGLSPLPAPGEQTPLITKHRGKGPVSSTRHIRELVQNCFDTAVERLQNDNLGEEAQHLMAATVHWLRHTGISDDVKHRPREHVRDDAGHSSGAITDKYIDIELRERHASAKNKLIKPDFMDDEA